MTATRRKHWVLFLTWLIATPIACAVGMGVSALFDLVIGDSSPAPGEGHILPLIIVINSTVMTLAIAFRVRSRRPDSHE